MEYPDKNPQSKEERTDKLNSHQLPGSGIEPVGRTALRGECSLYSPFTFKLELINASDFDKFTHHHILSSILFLLLSLVYSSSSSTKNKTIPLME